MNAQTTGFEYTKIRLLKPDLATKKLHLDPDGNLVKTSAGQIVEAVADRKQAENLADFCAEVMKAEKNECLIFGIFAHPKAKILTRAELEKQANRNRNGGLPTVARDRNHCRYPTGPGLWENDIDTDQERTPDEIRQALISVLPELEAAAMAIRASAGSCIFHGDKQLTGATGYRAWIPVDNAADIPRLHGLLLKRLWLAGRGKIKISDAGALLIRNMDGVDPCTDQPERIDFIADAVCTPPLEQHRPEPSLYNKDKPPLDTRQIRGLTAAQDREYKSLVDQAKQEAAPAARAQRAIWIEKRINEELARHPGATEDEKAEIRKRFTLAADRHVLTGAFVLYPADGGEPFTVADALADKAKYHAVDIREPLHPDKANGRARLFLLNTNRPGIWSFVLQNRYSLTLTRKKFTIEPGARCEIVDGLLDTAREEGTFFLRGGDVVTVTDTGEVLPLDTTALQYKLDGLADFDRYDARSKTLKGADCKKSYAEGFTVAARLSGGLPELKGIITHPTLDPQTGRIINRDGYDKETGLLLQMDATAWPDIPANPDRDAIRKAAGKLLHPFRLFPFADNVDRGVFLSCLLAAIIRALLDLAPLFMIDATTPGTGKTLLARATARLIGLSHPAVFPFSNDENEIRKRIFSIFRRGARLVVLDNITGDLSSETLCAALTSPYLEDRVLGASQIIKAPTNALFLATGNNCRPAGDMTRRTVKCRLDAQTEKPWKRSFDENLIETIDRTRPELITAALIILKGTLESGFTVSDGLGSFEDWNRTARAAVCYLHEIGLADVMDPAISIEEGYTEDPETAKLRALLTAWRAVFFDTGATVAEAITRAKTNSDLWDACEEISGEKGYLNTRRLARWIERQRGRIVDGLAFELQTRTGGKNHWRVNLLNFYE